MRQIPVGTCIPGDVFTKWVPGLLDKGFECFTKLIDEFKPKYFIHSHVHLNYGHGIPRILERGSTTIINAYERYDLEI